MKHRISLFLCLLVFIPVSCKEPVNENYSTEKAVIVTWNVQNLFNGTDDGNEYYEYTSEGGWKENYYKARLSSVNEVFNYKGLEKADIVVLNEVENERVVEDILSLPHFAKMGFKHYATASSDDSAISTAVISRLEIEDVKIHSFTDQRPILQVEFNVSGKSVFLLAVHAKSKIGEEAETTAMRFETAVALSGISAELKMNYPGCGIVIAGDFNEEVEEGNMMKDMRLRKHVLTDCPLKVCGECKSEFWYCFWLDSNVENDAEGSHFYDGKWEKIDNMLVMGMNVVDADVVFEGLLKNTEGHPNSWVRNLLTGTSDHLPLRISVEF